VRCLTAAMAAALITSALDEALIGPGAAHHRRSIRRVAGPRDYTTGTERALFALAGLTCYHPGCEVEIVVFIEGEPVVNVEIAHIYGAHPGAPRYKASMSDDERRSFSNLLLLCKPHHILVDRLHVDRYPAELLKSWKLEREQGRLDELRSVASLTEERLIALIESAVRSAGPERRAEVELLLGAVTGHGLMTVPPDNYSWLATTNPGLGVPALIMRIRNKGALPVFLESQSLRFNPIGPSLMGRNDFPMVNPALPLRLDSGESASWCSSVDLVSRIVAFFGSRGHEVESVSSEARLGSGETIESEPVDTSAFILSSPP
jgi:hypothetical protein